MQRFSLNCAKLFAELQKPILSGVDYGSNDKTMVVLPHMMVMMMMMAVMIKMVVMVLNMMMMVVMIRRW